METPEAISKAYEKIHHHYQQLYSTPFEVSWNYLRSITESQWEELREHFLISQGHYAISMVAYQWSNARVGSISYRYLVG